MTTRTATEEITRTAEKTAFAIEGLALLETAETMPEEMKLTAYVFDPVGKLLGSAPLDPKGRFNVPVHLDRAADVQLVVGPAGDTDLLRASTVYKANFLAKDWIAENGRYLLKPRVFVHKTIWDLWKPVPIFVSGHVRTTDGRPIPFLKVEIFDVDREGFFWPHLLKKAATFPPNLRVMRIPDLLGDGPVPPPGPDFIESFEAVAPQATFAEAMEPALFPEEVSLNPQPEPPAELFALRAQTFVGEMATAAPAVVAKLANLTLTSKVPIWKLCHFYSKRLVATVYTDNTGSFGACFDWPQFHVRYGKLRFDSRPDIILRVTQTIDGIERVLYLDPYTSTRWNVTSTHIDLWLDDPAIVAGTGVSPVAPPAMQAFFTRIGNDEVFHIDQTTGLGSADAPYPNVAYGYVLDFRGQFGKSLTAGAPKRYYQLSYRRAGAVTFTPVNTPLSDVRVDGTTLAGETYSLGPKNVNGTQALYEVRDLDHFYWYNPDRLLQWDTRAAEPATGVYTLRLEVFDENGQPLAHVDYRDGTAEPPVRELPKMSHCDLLLAVQNLAPTVHLDFQHMKDDNGVIPWSATQTIDFKASVAQTNGRIYSFGVYYIKGLDSAVADLPFGDSYSAGIPAFAQTMSIPVSSLGSAGSYALAFKLYAWSHIRNGYSFPYYNEQIKAIAVVKCPQLAVSTPALATT